MASAAALACTHVLRLKTSSGDDTVNDTVSFVKLDGLSDHLLAVQSPYDCLLNYVLTS